MVRNSYLKPVFKCIIIMISATFFLNFDILAQPEEVDVSFSTGAGPNLGVYVTLEQPDGKIIVGGGFSMYDGTESKRITRINSDGTLDPSFDPGTAISSSSIVYTIALQQDGKILIGGNFTEFNGSPRNSRMARLNADGSLDQSFIAATGTFFSINSIVIQPDGKILIGGWFDDYNGSGIRNIARLNDDGSIDPTFDPGTSFNNPVNVIALKEDGRIVVGGNFVNFNGISRGRIAQLNANGSLDTTFDPGTGFNNSVFCLASNPDGKIFAGGSFSNYNNIERRGIVRINEDGSLDNSFDPGTGTNSNSNPITINAVIAIALLPENKILLGGDFPVFNGTFLGRLVSLNEDGSTFNTFEAGLNSVVRSINEQADGKILIAGDFTAYNTWQANRIIRLDLSSDCIETSATDFQNHCESFTWIDGITYTSSNNTAIFTLVNAAGCDSIVTLNLTIQSIDLTVTEIANTLSANELNASYQWLDCNNNNSPLANENALSFSPSQTGNYAVEITKEGCTDTSDCIQVIITSVIENDIQSTFNIFPNPFSDQIHLRFLPDSNPSKFMLMDAAGRIIFNFNLENSSNMQVVDLNKFESGLYLVVIEFKNNLRVMKRVIKQ